MESAHGRARGVLRNDDAIVNDLCGKIFVCFRKHFVGTGAQHRYSARGSRERPPVARTVDPRGQTTGNRQATNAEVVCEALRRFAAIGRR